MADDDLFGGDGWFDSTNEAPASTEPPPETPAAALSGPLPDAEPPLDLTAGISPDDIRRAGQALESALTGELDRGFAAMRETMRAALLPGRRANPSDAQPIIVRLTDARDFALRMADGWRTVAGHAEALVGNLLEEAGTESYGRTGAVTHKATVADGHGSEIVAAYKPKITHTVNSETVLGCIRALAGVSAEFLVPSDHEPRAAFHAGATWALETLLRLANVDRTWRRTEIDAFARQIEEAGNPELAAELRRAVASVEEEGKTVIERREPKPGRASRGAAR